jgi:arylsulfatase A-like enzyme
MRRRPNVVVLFPDQLRASSLPIYGERQIETPHIDRLASESVRLSNSISNCPVCTPARAMLVTGRHPQTTGHLINSTRTRHSEISIADAFAHQGYRTGWVGKWHLHTGLWPALDRMPQHPDWVPEGRDRLGFDFWRAYNQHMVFFDGFVHMNDWNYERWNGYETEGLLDYAFEFVDASEDDPFLLFVSPHPPHFTPFEFAPEECYAGLPTALELPANVPPERVAEAQEMYRHYLAMIRAVDTMVGRVTAHLEKRGLADDTILVFASDHGTQAGAHGVRPWSKKHPYEESIRIPTLVRWPGVLEAGAERDALFGMPDFFPTLCGLAGVPVPRTVEGRDLSGSLLGTTDANEQQALLLMNFSKYFDWFEDGAEWRGVRTATATYAEWLDGRVQLFDLTNDPLQMRNLASEPSARGLRDTLRNALRELQGVRRDELVSCTAWKHWLDNQRRVVRNAFGELPHPESIPDWSLLH